MKPKPTTKRRKRVTQEVAGGKKSPATKKFGWCSGNEIEQSHDTCPGSIVTMYESANYNVGDIAYCACECHTAPKKEVKKRGRKPVSKV